MGKIVELNQHVSNQIAAGEVVERPCSVIKELVENALDAQATAIEVRIKDGGLAHLIVQDNGVGMDSDDVEKCIKRYATSKILSAHDLQSLSTFGFRGEALPSIASISRMTIISRQNEQEYATKAIIDAGSLREMTQAGALMGTRIEVRDIFFNVPARLKFMKSARSEASQIDKLLRAFAFIYPHVAWKFFNDEKLVFSSAHENVLERASALLGSDTKGMLYNFQAQSDIVELSGAICAPLITRNDIRGIHVFVNKRVVSDRKISGALKAAFRTLLEVGQNPILALSIEVPPDQVDVNVHPRKAEVRFVDERRVFSHIISMLGNFLAETPWLKAEVGTKLPAVEQSQEFYNQALQNRQTMDFVMKSAWPDEPIRPNNPSLFEQAQSTVSWQKPLLPAKKYSDLRVIGQVVRTYLLCESEDGLVLLDQHAAHERVMFEYLRSQKTKGVTSSPLLIPLRVELDSHEMMLALSHLEDFQSFGMELDAFGENSLVIRALPDFMKDINAASLIKDILSEFLLLGRAESVDKIYDQVCATMACHGSVRAGQLMSNEQIKALLLDLDSIPYAAHCPHGRPIIKSFAKTEMKTWFDRT